MTNILKQPYITREYAEFAAEATKIGKWLEIQPNGDVWMINPPLPTLEEAKQAKLAENEQKRDVEFITTSLGRMKTQTPLGDLKTAIGLYEKLAKAQNGLPKGAVRLYDTEDNITLSPAMTFEQVEAVLLQISMAYIQIDQKSTAFSNVINAAQTVEELVEIEIEY